jgi:hypothetical protein
MPSFHKGRNGKILGVGFSKAEQKAMDEEIDRQWKEATVEYDRKHEVEISSLILWVLYEHFGFREKRLKKMFLFFDKYVMDMLNRYQLSDKDDDVWLCTRQLKEAGYDIEEWSKEAMSLGEVENESL